MRTILFLLVVALSFTACHTRRNEGPAERTGRKIDNAADDIGDAAHSAKENIKDAADDVEDSMERRDRY